MQVVILAGGLGTRLREETEFRPKPMVEIGGYPILWHIMKIYAHYGFRDFVICLGYRGNVIKEYFLNYEAMNNDFTICLGEKHQITYHNSHAEQDFRVTLVDTGLPTLTGGRLKRIEKYIHHETFMVTYGDGVADVNINQLLTYHKEHGQLATVTTVHPSSRFGIVNVDSQGQVKDFAEKPQEKSWANAGFLVFNRGVFDYLPGDDFALEDGLQQIAIDGKLMAYRHEGFFYAMDTYREYQYLNQVWDKGKAPWKVWE